MGFSSGEDSVLLAACLHSFLLACVADVVDCSDWFLATPGSSGMTLKGFGLHGLKRVFAA